MKLLILIVIAAVSLYYGMKNLNTVAIKAGEDRKKDLTGILETNKSSMKSSPALEKEEPESIEPESVKKASIIKTTKSVPLKRRPSFYVMHRGIKPQDCNLAYQEESETIIPTDMQIHDYFKWGDSKYYFAVSTDNQKFLLKATDIIKEKCAEKDLKLAFKFAKYCRAKDQPKPQVTAKPTVSETKDEWALTSKEEAHIKSSIKTLSLKADHFRQSGNILKLYEDYKRDRRKETFEKVTGTYYLIEGHIPETYRVATRTGYTTKTVRSATLWSTRGHSGKRAYCTSFEMAYYHAVCEYFETVKRKFYKGPKPTAPRTRNYQ